MEFCASLFYNNFYNIDEIMQKKCVITYRSRCSKHIRSLATRSFLAMIFFRFSTVLELSTSTEKLPPVVVEMLSVIGGKVQLFSVLLLPHPSAKSRGSFDEDFSIILRARDWSDDWSKTICTRAFLLIRLKSTEVIVKNTSFLHQISLPAPHFNSSIYLL